MNIEHFASNQNTVFIPALIAVLIATVAICTPVVLAPSLRRAGHLRAVGVGVAILAAGALTAAGFQAGQGFRALGSQRTLVQREVEQRFGLQLSSGQVNELVNGGSPSVSLPARAEALGISWTKRCDVLQFVQRTVKVAGQEKTALVPDTYDLRLDRTRLPQSDSRAETAPLCDPTPPRSGQSQ